MLIVTWVGIVRLEIPVTQAVVTSIIMVIGKIEIVLPVHCYSYLFYVLTENFVSQTSKSSNYQYHSH